MKNKQTENRNIIINDNVSLGEESQVDAYCLIGYGGQGKVVIGKKALIRSHSVIYFGNIIGNNFKTGNGVNIRENNRIGNDVSIGSHSVIEHDVVIEDKVRIHSNVFIPELSVLKKGCWLGPNVVLTNAHLPQCKNRPKCFCGVVIEAEAKIGANATILPGVVIGKRAVVGAGAVVVKNVLEDQVVVGNPARSIKKVSDIVCPIDFSRK